MCRTGSQLLELEFFLYFNISSPALVTIGTGITAYSIESLYPYPPGAHPLIIYWDNRNVANEGVLSAAFQLKMCCQTRAHARHTYNTPSRILFSAFVSNLEKLISKNYFLNLSAKEAYKAFVRAYDSHSLKHIFDVNRLDLVAVAKSFGFGVPPFVDLPVSGKNPSRTQSYRKGGAPGGGRKGSGYVPPMSNQKRAHKSVIYRAVPIHKDKRQFSR
ncbi:unnamed protein product [Medioppia subpectinata]|uniref:ATP-dependent rRNA helicase SPB4-like C-terminal extension domain-containing protein n=1 Tax=Medioppia subpectinata TaxID=1979941 RepID=A0A7R9KL78_9ACAR|nr:unnamed protein product [Medioppia subpectinata]CAG2104502.1 unnamed protein product [Medioppia subpectinata]